MPNEKKPNRKAYARRGIEVTRDQSREPLRAQKRLTNKPDEIQDNCDEALRRRGILPPGEREKQKRAAWNALNEHQQDRRVMVHKRQFNVASESLDEVIARDERRKRLEMLAAAVRRLGIISCSPHGIFVHCSACSGDG